jgi:hypothetical protein
MVSMHMSVASISEPEPVWSDYTRCFSDNQELRDRYGQLWRLVLFNWLVINIHKLYCECFWHPQSVRHGAKIDGGINLFWHKLGLTCWFGIIGPFQSTNSLDRWPLLEVGYPSKRSKKSRLCKLSSNDPPFTKCITNYITQPHYPCFPQRKIARMTQTFFLLDMNEDFIVLCFSPISTCT